MKKSSSHGQEGWLLENDSVSLFLTETGGHAAPVRFFPSARKPIEPYYISPWQEEKTDIDVPVLIPLRGNFFCAPFGADNRLKGEDHTPHGEPATAVWPSPTVTIEGDRAYLRSILETRERPGKTVKEIFLHKGHTAVYQRHTLEGYKGSFPLGHHATLAPPAKGSLMIGHSPIQFGMTSPWGRVPAADGEYYSLSPLSRFAKIDKVPTRWKQEPYTDCSLFPAREGFVDLLQIFQKPPRKPDTPAWICATAAEEGYLWFALKNPALLNSTVFWMENHGRHQAPWNGRNCCIGLEDVTAYFAEGLKASAAGNILNEAGIETVVKLNPGKALVVPYIEGVTRVSKGFGRVVKVRFEKGRAVFIDEAGKESVAAVAWDFLFGREL